MGFLKRLGTIYECSLSERLFGGGRLQLTFDTVSPS